MLCGSGDAEPQSEVTAQLAQEIYNANLLEQLIGDLAKIDFEVSLSSWLPFLTNAELLKPLYPVRLLI